jgi:hypothetical protein
MHFGTIQTRPYILGLLTTAGSFMQLDCSLPGAIQPAVADFSFSVFLRHFNETPTGL